METIPLRRYHRSRSPRKGLQLGFAAVDVREIRRGTEHLLLHWNKSRNSPEAEYETKILSESPGTGTSFCRSFKVQRWGGS
jgi:hypothetical protein